MAQALAYKNLAIGVEGSYGASIATSDYASVRSFNLNLDPTYQTKTDTTSSSKGFERSAYLRDMLEGEVGFNVGPLESRFWFRLALGGGVTISDAAVPGGGATAMYFPQNTDGVLETYRIDKDMDTATKGYLGVAPQSLDITSSGDFIEGTVNITGKSEFTSTTFTPTGVTVNPFVFAESHIYYGATVTGCTNEVYVDSWSTTYDLQTEQSHQSGNRQARRVDPNIPLCTGEWERFYDDTNFDDFIDNETAKALKIDIVGSQTYSGSSPYRLEIYIPKVKITTKPKTYEASTMIKETVTWEATYDSEVGYMFRPYLYNGLATF